MQEAEKCYYNWHPTQYDPRCGSVSNADLVASNLVLHYSVYPLETATGGKTFPQNIQTVL